jgi:WD40 repeat protein
MLLEMSYVGHQNSVMCLCVWGELLFSGSFTTEIIGWNEFNGQLLRFYDGHSAPVRVLSVFGGVLYSAGEENAIISWNIDSGSIRNYFPRHHINLVWCFAYEEGNLYSGSTDTNVFKWDVNSGSRVFAYFGRNIRLRSVVLWKGFVISSGENPFFRVYDKAENNVSPVEIMSGHSFWIVCMAVLDDTLFSGSVDTSIRRTSLIDYKELQVYNGNLSLSIFSLFRSSTYYKFTSFG